MVRHTADDGSRRAALLTRGWCLRCAEDAANLSTTLVALLKDRARSMAVELAEDFNHASAEGLDFDQALNSVAVAGWHATECHCMCKPQLRPSALLLCLDRIVLLRPC